MLIEDFLKLKGIEDCNRKRTLQVLHKVNGKDDITVLNQCIVDNMILIITDLSTYKSIKPTATRQKLGIFFLNKLSRINKAGSQYIEFLGRDSELFINGNLMFNGNNEFFLVSKI